MKILSITEQPGWYLPFLNAGKGPGGFYRETLPVQTGLVDRLPEGLDALIATADLQGRETFESAGGGPLLLLGEILPQILADEILPELDIEPQRTAVVLAGDLYTVAALNKRGGSGDVTQVWQAFGREFQWATGVAGNHDTFGNLDHPASRMGKNIHYLDGEEVELSGLRIAGIGGIVGNPRRRQRKTGQQFVASMEKCIHDELDILVMHDGPGVPEQGLKGSALIRMTVDVLPPKLIIRGHAHWDTPLATLPGGTDVLNVDGRVVILQANGKK